ncbi:sigma-70 family RNA polymerase sigma factor [Methylobacterium aquaticum]|uniref:sigma-70 family RNA polymerase sigma factor n=1 Tax=Methylobacterium aquaticum TaxID=270351 RepID=UPI001932CEC0|nr:sigma-70 family RNA polymerase sigma factor [Methylobacterium aquaticum]QRE75526.1 sigma-70 family RNA polymerase sigma factor [Methylobacterium aquaticum]
MKTNSTAVPPAPPPPSDPFPAHVIQDHLRQSLQHYFSPVAETELPARLAELLARFEAALAARGEAISFDFRNALMTALPALRTFGLSLSHDVVRADDLVQETCARAWANQHRFQAGTNFTAWLFTIMRNQFYTELRKGRREVEDGDGILAGQLAAPADQDHASTLRVVRERMQALPEAQRQALLLIGAEGYTYEEAAVKLGCQVGTVKSRVSRARSSLLAALGEVVDH